MVKTTKSQSAKADTPAPRVKKKKLLDHVLTEIRSEESLAMKVLRAARAARKSRGA